MENSEKTKISIKNDVAGTGFSSNPPKAKNKEKTKENQTNLTENKIKKSDIKQNEGFFDATAPLDDIKQKDMTREIEKVHNRAIKEHEILERIKNSPNNSKKTYVSLVSACFISVGLLLILTIIAFIFLKWYLTGVILAVITVVVSQVWVVFFKKTNKQTNDDFYIDDKQNEQTLQEYLATKDKKENNEK